MVIFFWPTYLFGIGYDFGQKAHYFISAFFAVILAMASGSRRISLVGVAIFLPLFLMVFVVFLLRIPVATNFEIGIIIKLFLLFVILHAAYAFIRPSFVLGREDGFIKAIFIVYGLEVVFVISQFILPDGEILKIWSAHPIKSYWGFRAPGTFEWVYALCFISVFILTYTGFSLDEETRKSPLTIYYFCVFSIFMCIVVLSQSKAGYVALFLSLIYGLLLDRLLTGKFERALISVIGGFVALLALFILFVGIEFSYISNFVELLSSGELDSSTNYRKYQIELAWSHGIENWHRGTVFDEDKLIIENAYFDYLYRYGIAGLFFYGLFSITLVLYSLAVLANVAKNLKLGLENSKIYRLMLATHLTFFSALWFSFSYAPLDGYKTSVWSYFCLALALVISQRQAIIRRCRSAA